MLEAIHDAQLREHGGSPGVRDEGLLEASLARPRHKFAHADRPDIATLAAAYAFGLAKNHGFVDGNKRTAFMAAYVFLGLNRYDLEAAEADVAITMERLADGSLTEVALANWIRARLAPILS
jgi:death on curing protein